VADLSDRELHRQISWMEDRTQLFHFVAVTSADGTV
jgi:hypothetical protein